MTIYYIKSGSATEEMDLGPAIEAGASATVFAVLGPGQFSDSTAKIYLDPRSCHAEKLQALIDDAPSKVWFEANSASRYPHFAWPQVIVHTQDKVSGELAPIGYLMPKVDPRAAVTLDAYFHQKLAETYNLPPESLSLQRRLDVAIGLCGLLADLHSKNIHCIDFNPKNILIQRAHGLVTFQNCDGFSIVSKYGTPYPATQYSKGYVAPEALKRGAKPGNLGEAQDCFALAVALFQIFNYGIYPYSGVIRPGHPQADDADDRARRGYYPYGLNQNPAIAPLPQSVHDLLPIKLRQLFDRAFVAGNTRPTAKEWTIALSSLKKAIRWAPCPAYPDDAEHIHFDGLPCSRCELERRIKVQKEIRAPATAVEAKVETTQATVSPPPAIPPADSLPAPAKPGRRGSELLKYLAAGAIVSILVYLLSTNDDPPRQVARQMPPDAPRQAVVQPRTNPETAIAERMPDVGGEERKPLSPGEIYWCIAKSHRIDVINEVLEKEQVKAPALFQASLEDYTARCEKYRYEREDLAKVLDYFATRKAGLADAAVAEAHQLIADAQRVASSQSTSNDVVARTPAPKPVLTANTSTTSGRLEPEKPRKPPERRQTTEQSPDYEQPRPVVIEARPASLSLLSAITRGDRASVEYYLDKGASPNAPLSTGATPLKTAVVSHNVGVAEVLLRRGADVNLRDSTGKTALQWARLGNSDAMIAMLLRYGATE